jgi:hypothetical protein
MKVVVPGEEDRGYSPKGYADTIKYTNKFLLV